MFNASYSLACVSSVEIYTSKVIGYRLRVPSPVVVVMSRFVNRLFISRWYSLLLFVLYAFFMLFNILDVTNIVKFAF